MKAVKFVLSVGNGLYFFLSLLTQIYKEEGVRLAVVDVVTWTMSDQIQIVEDPDVLLDRFLDYSPNLPQNYDSAMLFTYVPLNGVQCPYWE